MLVVSRPRWPPVPVVLAVVLLLVVLVVWRAQSAPVPGLGVDPVHRVRVVVCRVMHTRVRRLVLLLVVRWVLARVLPGLVLVWALVVVFQDSVLVRQALQANCRVQPLPEQVPAPVRPVVVAV